MANSKKQSSEENTMMVELFKNLIVMTDKGTLNEILEVYGKTKDDIVTWLESK